MVCLITTNFNCLISFKSTPSIQNKQRFGILNLHKDICSWFPVLNNKLILAISIFCFLLSTNSFSDNITPTTIKNGTISNNGRQTITIQVISHKKDRAAERELKRLKSHGLDAIVSYELVKDKGMFYRVYVGQFENRKTALAFANELVEKGIISGFWVKKTNAFVETVTSPEARQHEIHKKTIKAQQQKEKPETVSKKSPSPPSPIKTPEMVETAEVLPMGIDQKEVAPPENQKPKTTDNTETEDVLHEVIALKEVAHATSFSVSEKDQEMSRLSIGIKTILSSTQKAGDFEIKRTSSGSTTTWFLADGRIHGGLVLNFQLNDTFAIEAGVERRLFTPIELWQLSIGPSFQFPQIGLLTPYIRGGFVGGDLKWDDAPGDFDLGIGWDGGIGFYLIKSKVKIGIEGSYQQLKYAYNKPSGQEVQVTDDYLDMSRYALSVTLSYLF